MSKPVKLKITGDNSQAIKALDQVGAAADRTAKRTAAASKRQAAAMDKIGTTALVAGGAMVAGFAGVVTVAAKFEQQMSKVGAVSGATGADLKKLSDAALKAGADTSFSASQAAQAEAELAKAGISTADILGGALRGSLALAAAGNIDLAQAAEVSAQTMNLFGLAGKDVTRIADTLAAGANKSAADIQTLADGLKQGGLVAKQTGMSLEETVGALALFADNALVGSDAGTSLKSMLQRLSNPSKEAKKQMDKLGVAMYDANGQFIGLEKLAGNLRNAFDDLTPAQRNAAMATIFGADSVRAAAILYESGAKGAREYTKAVTDQGAASRVASKYLDNLSGDLEALKGSLETALIQGGSKATGALRSMTQATTGLVNAFATAPEGIQSTILAITGAGGASLLAVGGIVKITGAVKEARSAFAAMSTGSVAALGGIGAALTVGGVLLANWAKEKEQARQATLQFSDAIRADSGVLGANTREIIRNAVSSADLLGQLADLSGSLSSGRAPLDVYTDAVMGNVDSQRELRRALLDSGTATLHTSTLNKDAARIIRDEWIRTGDDVEDIYDRLTVAQGSQGPALRENITLNSRLNSELEKNVSTLGRAVRATQAEAGTRKDSAAIARELTAAETGLRDAVALHGRQSEQARAAQTRYNTALAAQNQLNREVAAAEADAARQRRQGASAADAAAGPMGRYAQRLREMRDAFAAAAAAGRQLAIQTSILTITNPNALPLLGRASGGPVQNNTPYIVGEQGPELFVPKTAGTIIPNGNLTIPRSAMSDRPAVRPGAGTQTVVPIIIELDGKVVAESVVKHSGRVGGLPIRIRAAS